MGIIHTYLWQRSCNQIFPLWQTRESGYNSLKQWLLEVNIKIKTSQKYGVWYSRKNKMYCGKLNFSVDFPCQGLSLFTVRGGETVEETTVWSLSHLTNIGFKASKAIRTWRVNILNIMLPIWGQVSRKPVPKQPSGDSKARQRFQ